MSEHDGLPEPTSEYDAAYKTGRQQAATFYNSIARVLGTNPDAACEVLENRAAMAHARMRAIERDTNGEPDGVAYREYAANDGMIERLNEIVALLDTGVLL